MYQHRMETLKEGAYFDYFKLFSGHASDTVRVLELAFKEQLTDEQNNDSASIFKNIKGLLSSYEILVMEINDACKFVEIPLFGACLSKIFYQLMSVIKFMGKSLLVRNAGENDGKVERTVKERFTLVGSTAASRGWPTQKPETRSKQLKDHFQIDKDFFGDNDYEDNTNEDNLMKNRLTKTMANYTLTLKENKLKVEEIEYSQNESILSETVNLLQRRSENLINFINSRQYVQLDQGLKDSDMFMCETMKDKIDEEGQLRIEKAKRRLNELFREKLESMEHVKREMRDMECQVKLEEEKEEKQPKGKLQEQVKKLKLELKIQEEKYNELHEAKRTAQLKADEELLMWRFKVDEIEEKMVEIQKQNFILFEQTKLAVKAVLPSVDNTIEEDKITSKVGNLTANGIVYEEEERLEGSEEIKVNLIINKGKQRLSCKSSIGRERERCSIADKHWLRANYIESCVVSIMINHNNNPRQNSTPTSTSHTYQKAFSLTISPSYIDPLPQKLSKKVSKDSLLSIKTNSTSRSSLLNLSNPNGKASKEGYSTIMTSIKIRDSKKALPKHERSLISKSRFRTLREVIDSIVLGNRPGKEISFTEEDIKNLYLSMSNAHSYELLNTNSAMQNLNLARNNKTTSAAFRTLTSTKKPIVHKFSIQTYKENFASADETSWLELISLLYQQMQNLKRYTKETPIHRLSYYNIRNFLRYPYSTVMLFQDEEWIRVQTDDYEIDESELRKAVGRIWKLHEKCHEEGEGARTVCEHFEGFFDKLGMYGTIGNEGIMTKNYLLSRVVEVPEPSMTTIGEEGVTKRAERKLTEGSISLHDDPISILES